MWGIKKVPGNMYVIFEIILTYKENFYNMRTLYFFNVTILHFYFHKTEKK